MVSDIRKRALFQTLHYLGEKCNIDIGKSQPIADMANIP